MKRLFSLLLWVLVFCGHSLCARQDILTLNDIPRVMERFFHFHIESKEFTPTLVRRSFKLYIEQFDGDKSYLLEAEAAPYLSMNAQRAEEILGRVKRGNYSDFIALNEIFEKAIARARQTRLDLTSQLLASGPSVAANSFSTSNSSYAKSEAELIQRQKARMLKFYTFHQTRTRLDSTARQEMVFQLFEKRVRRIESSYLLMDNSNKESKAEHFLVLRILKSLAKSLDTHTAFFSPEEAYEMRLSLEKQFEGVGVVLSEGVDGVLVADLIDGGPAKMSGQIQVNDLLVEIDGRTLSQAPFEEVLELLKKKDRSDITLGFKRVDPEMNKEVFFRVSLTKQPISMKDDRIRTHYEQVEGGVIGKITLHSFYESSDGVSSERDIKEAIRGFREHGELKGLILDLRENAGGFLGQAVRVAGLFVSNGVIVISKYGKGDVHFLRNIVGKSYFDGPLIVLTSKMSASASEIVAQALQDYGVALVVGDERTFGKGSIQYQTLTDENADLFFKVTVGRYYTVSGRSTQIEGVIADIVVPSAYAPYKIGERYLEYPLTQDKVPSAYTDPLSDLDDRSRQIFRQRYLPSLQKVVSFWKTALPELKKKSQARMASDPQFRKFLDKLETVRARQTGTAVNSIDEPVEIGMYDVQMQEATQILKDMIQMKENVEHRGGSVSSLLPTGSD